MKGALKYSFIAIFLNLIIPLFAFTGENPKMRFEDKIRIKEAMSISETYGEEIWKGFNIPPFAIILVTDQYEFLINHPYPSNDFKLIGKDEILNTNIHFRSQQFNKGFLATFPAVNGVNCIVIGTPENTGLNSTQWIITLLHERFHQYQYTSPNYHQDALDLGLSGGDQSGMWQLNYPFPYQDENVLKNYDRYVNALVETVDMLENENWKKTYRKLMRLKKLFKRTLSENDYKYISFQWYQEGVARYTEYAFLKRLDNYEPSKKILNLPDFISYKNYATLFFERHLANVVRLKLSENKRITVYDVGFAQSLILDRQNPSWRESYLKLKFDLDKLHL